MRYTNYKINIPKIFLVMLLLLCGQIILAQIPAGDFTNLRNKLAQKINKLRILKKLEPLQTNPILRKAAKNQSVYLAKTRKLSHNQNKFELSDPYKRVHFFKGFQFTVVGENVLSSTSVRLPLRNNIIESLATEMFTSWKNSPGHYENMINPAYDFGDIDFHFDPKDKVIYATQVFGKKGVRVPGLLSEDAFGIGAGTKICEDAYGSYDNVVANMGNAIQIEGNKVIYYYHSMRYFNKIFASDQDGLAVDLVFRDQVACGSENRIDYSPVHDGIMLAPVFKKDILANNTAESEYRIISQVGTIPDELLAKEFSCSVILIKNGVKCKYLIPGDVPSKRYDLRPIQPVLANPDRVKLKNEGIIKSQEIQYDFKTNITTPVSYPTLGKINHPVHSVQISSFSSVEGDENKNAMLHNARAQSIKKHLKNKLAINKNQITIDAKENWDKMYFQLRYFMANDLAEESKEDLKELLAGDDQTLPWESLLFDQRKSIATINYRGVLSASGDEEKRLEMNFKTALFINDFDLANKALYEMYHKDKIPSALLFEEAIFNNIIRSPEITQNIAAVFSKIYQEDYRKTIEFLFSWLNEEKALSAASEENLLHLYSLISTDLLKSWDTSAKRLSNVIHPSVVQEMVSENLSDELMLNLDLTFIKYYGQINDGPNISKSFNYISNYFKSRALKIEDEIDLVLFFNLWSSYGLTNEFLLKKFKEGTLNEEATFILLKTLTFYDEGHKDQNTFDEISKKAFELNKFRWCAWINEEFQILRNQKIKNLFCRHCKD